MKDKEKLRKGHRLEEAQETVQPNSMGSPGSDPGQKKTGRGKTGKIQKRCIVLISGIIPRLTS